jgi:hypothetical protein
MTSALALSAPYHPQTMDLTAEEVMPQHPSWVRAFTKRAGRWSETMAFRIAVPPLAIWAALYSLVEYLA